MGTEVFDRIRKGKTPINVPLTNISTAYFQSKSGGATSFFPEIPVIDGCSILRDFASDIEPVCRNLFAFVTVKPSMASPSSFYFIFQFPMRKAPYL